MTYVRLWRIIVNVKSNLEYRVLDTEIDHTNVLIL